MNDDPRGHKKKLEKLAKIRSSREERLYRQHQAMVSQLNNVEAIMQQKRAALENFMTERSSQVRRLKHQIHTKAVSGAMIERYLHLREDTQTQIDEMYAEIEKSAKEYHKMLDATNQSYKTYETAAFSRNRIDRLVVEQEGKVKDFLELMEEEELNDIIMPGKPTMD